MHEQTLAQAAASIDECIKFDVPIMLHGSPGLGKTSAVEQAAARHGFKVITIIGSLIEPVDLRGLPHITTDGVVAWATPIFLPNEARDGPEGILFLDEINAAPMAVQVAMFQLIQARRVGEYALPKGWRIVAAGNLRKDRAAAQRLPTALANRMTHVHTIADLEAWSNWATGAGVDPILVAFLNFRTDRLLALPKDDSPAFPSPRSWVNASKFTDSPDAVRPGLIAGLVGTDSALEFESFLRVYRGLPKLGTILANPEGADLVTAMDQKWALTSALARHAQPSNFGAVITYTTRLSREHSVMAIRSASKRDPELQNCKPFIDWIQKPENQEIFA